LHIPAFLIMVFLRTMKFLFWSCFALLIPGMLLRIPFGGAGILATDLLIPIFSFSWVFYKLTADRTLPHNSFLFSGIIFLLAAGFSFLLNAWELALSAQFLSGAYLLRFLTLLLFSWGAQDLFRTQKLINGFFERFFLLSFFVVFLGFLQFYLVPSLATFSTEGGLDPHEGRMLGTWLDPNFFGGFVAFLLPFLLGYISRVQKQSWKILFWIFWVISLFALFLTFSRSAYLAAGTGLFFYFLFQNPKILVIAVFVSFLGLSINERAQQRVESLMGTFAAVLFQDTDEIDPTAIHRIKSWSGALGLWQKYPIFGIGYNTYRFKASEEGLVDENYFSSGGSDSTLLTILVTTGVFGLILFLFFLGKVLWVAWSGFWETRDNLFWGFFCSMCSLLVHAVFVNSLLFPFVFLTWICIAALLENEKQLMLSQK